MLAPRSLALRKSSAQQLRQVQLGFDPYGAAPPCRSSGSLAMLAAMRAQHSIPASYLTDRFELGRALGRTA